MLAVALADNGGFGVTLMIDPEMFCTLALARMH